MRENWRLSARLLAALCIPVVLAASPLAARDVTLEDESLLVAFDSHSGAITRLEDKTAHWTIERRPELGMSFRIFAPLPDRRWNPIYGQKQKAAEVNKVSAHEVRLKWKKLASENGGVLPITLDSVVTLTNGMLTFAATLVNDSPLTVETIDYPYLGDVSATARDSSLKVITMREGKLADLRTDEVYPHFHNEKGYWGVFWPIFTREAHLSAFCLIQAPGHGVYLDLNVPTPPYRMEYTFEQHPGLISSVNSLVPPEDKISGTPVHLEFRACHFVFEPGHSTTNLAPVVLSCYQGEAKAGLELYQQSQSAAH